MLICILIESLALVLLILLLYRTQKEQQVLKNDLQSLKELLPEEISVATANCIKSIAKEIEDSTAHIRDDCDTLYEDYLKQWKCGQDKLTEQIQKTAEETHHIELEISASKSIMNQNSESIINNLNLMEELLRLLLTNLLLDDVNDSIEYYRNSKKAGRK